MYSWPEIVYSQRLERQARKFRTDGRRKNRSKGYYSSLNALGSADFMKSRSKIGGSLYDIAWRTKSVRQGSVRRGGRHLLSWISVNSPASRTSRAWNQETLQRPQWIHCRRNPLLAGNIPETRFSQEKYIQYKITKIVHIVEVKKHIMSAVLFFKKKFYIMLILPNYAQNYAGTIDSSLPRTHPWVLIDCMPPLPKYLWSTSPR